MRPYRWIAIVGLIAMAAFGVVNLSRTEASDPPSQDVTIPTEPGQTVTVTWTGTIPPGTNPSSGCELDPSGATEDVHTIALDVPEGAYQQIVADVTFSITWTPPSGDENTADEILTVAAPAEGGDNEGSSRSSDGSETTELVTFKNPFPGDYEAIACGFINALPQDYEGKLVIETSALKNESNLPSADADGLGFSAGVPADPQRDEAEPLITIDNDGRAYTCGPTGFSNAADYAQVSDDGGMQFHILGQPPRGQQAAGGGGDCATAEAPVRSDPESAYNYAYTGLGPLTGFATATSPDGGHTLTTSPDNGSIPGVDRQWETFLDENTVLLSYNRQAPRAVEVLKSTDGGLTFNPACCTATSTPTFPGPLKTLAPKFNPDGSDAGRVVYFPWTSQSGETFYVNLGVSNDGGTTWTDCVVATSKYDVSNNFPVADNDEDGNIYVAWTDSEEFHTYMAALAQPKLKDCNGPSAEQPTENPGFSTPVQVDRDDVRSSLFPWIAARGKAGRVAVAFYGTETQGDPNTGEFKASWDVYVNQSLNALGSGATFSQVKATTHPFHYDSICLNGLGCDLSVPPGDRTLADFFALDYNPASGRLMVVFNRAEKMPDEAAGHVAIPMVITQRSGPSNGGGMVDDLPSVVRTTSNDPEGDALASYSALGATPTPTNEPAGDFTKVEISPQLELESGEPVADGGFTVTMKLADLSDGALQQEMTDTSSLSLLWVFRFANGYQTSAASARYNLVEGFTFGFNDFTAGSAQCGGSGDKCVLYPGDTEIQGDVDQETGTIRLSVPRGLLRGLKGSTGDGERPEEVPAAAGTRLYDGTAFSMGNPVSPVQDVQQFMYTLDNAPAMDFKVPGATSPGTACNGADVISGTEGADILTGTPGDDVICALGGDDVIRGMGGDDVIIAGAGDDRIKGGKGADLIVGSRGKDTIAGGKGKDQIRGGRGPDVIDGNDKNDVILGGGSDDTVRGNKGWDTIRGGPGNDVLQGGYGNDVLTGNRGGDTLKGFGGDDLLSGGKGTDRCQGGKGKDRVKHCEA